MRKTHIVFVESAKKEVIENQLLVALDDKSKVALVIDEEDLQLLILGLGALSLGNKKKDEMRWKLLENLRELKTQAFRTSTS